MFAELEQSWLDDMVLSCNKSGYGFVDAPFLFRRHLNGTLTGPMKCSGSRYDECVYYQRDSKGHVLVTADTHVDDIEVEGEWGPIQKFKAELEKVLRRGVDKFILV